VSAKASTSTSTSTSGDKKARLSVFAENAVFRGLGPTPSPPDPRADPKTQPKILPWEKCYHDIKLRDSIHHMAVAVEKGVPLPFDGFPSSVLEAHKPPTQKGQEIPGYLRAPVVTDLRTHSGISERLRKSAGTLQTIAKGKRSKLAVQFAKHHIGDEEWTEAAEQLHSFAISYDPKSVNRS